MLPHKHLLINFTIGTILINLFEISTLDFYFFVFSTLIIDLDHLINFIFTMNLFSIKKNFKKIKHLVENKIPKFFIFHTFEFMIFLLLLALINQNVLFIFFGALTHLISDALSYIYFYKKDFSWIKHWSLIWNIKQLIK
jgi:hypothetical protein